ncbi:MAG TPA: RNA polymerase sigma factor [Verrucomicrobiae bacterium]|nr:RNA polymerase sigma factor [Verrucomicrobiae bacterium]
MTSAELERLYDEHAQALFGFLINLTRSEADTRDVLQDVFCKMAANPKLLDPVRDERAFLLRLAHNQAIDLLRRRQTRQKVSAQIQHEAESVFIAAASADEETFRAELGTALAELPSEQRVVVHLRVWEGLTFEAIAELLDIPLNTAASRCRYGLDKLRARLRPLYDEIK